MTPANRGPRGNPRGKQKTRSTGRSARVIRGADGPCDCPACSGQELDPTQMLADLVDGAGGLAACEDPLEAEMVGALFVAMALAGGEDIAPAFADALIPAIEARGGDAALMLLTAIGAAASVSAQPLAQAAVLAADRLAGSGFTAPAWARELAQPLRGGDFLRLYDLQGTMSVLIGSFHRADREHVVMMVVNHLDCGAAEDILILDAVDLPVALNDIREGGRSEGLTIKAKKLAAPEFAWYVDQAMQTRAVHDDQYGDEDDLSEMDLVDVEEGPGYSVLAVLLRARLAVLPRPRRPKDAVVSGHGTGKADGSKIRKQLAPVYQLKVSLRGARPPIWRRLLVPADASLAELHEIILSAFGWHGDHMHVFETVLGEFGLADSELGHRSDASVTLEQVAPGRQAKFRYTYDFGDDWEHDILVEKVFPQDPLITYPRCIAGKRAAPPDDCGGIWGYAELIAVLADPTHPAHEERLQWMGLADASEFTPDTVDLDEVNLRLGTHL